jgi:predicted CoA-substrate-specific enzyme activase
MKTLGIDVGSRSVKGVVYDCTKKSVIASAAIDTTTDTKKDAHQMRDMLFGMASIDSVDRTVATGYGRSMVEFATDITTEITCHAVGVLSLFPQVKTIIDIGGQDSKVIHIGDGVVRDFTMNDRCAAGTGRFLEVVAKILGTDVDGMAELAMNSSGETEISSMCVVFAESEVIGMMTRGTPREELAAGIHKAIARRIAGMAERGRYETPVVFTGGVAKNKAMVRALGVELRERLMIPPDSRITGALGASLIASRKLGHAGDLDDKDIHRNHKVLVTIGAATKAEETCSCNSSVPEQKIPETPCSCGSVPAEPCRHEEKPAQASPFCETKPPKRPTSCGEMPKNPYVHTVPTLTRFDRMVQNSIDYATYAKKQGKKVISIYCEYTPRELILAAGAVPVCACGGSHQMALESEKELPANLCPLIKSSYGFHIEHANPLFEMSDLVIAETTCDGKKKMYELMNVAKPMHVLELTQKPDESEAFNHWLSEVKILKAKLEALTGNQITNEKLSNAIMMMNRERKLRRTIASLSSKGLKGSEILDAKSLIACIPEDLEAYEDIIAQAQALPSDNSNKPRILMTGVPMPHGAEKVINLIEEAGAKVVVQENCTGVKPLLEDVDETGDPLEAIAKKYFHLECSCMTPNKGRFGLIDRLINEYRPEGIIDLVWMACLTYSVESTLLKRHIEENHKMPFLKIETDYSPSDIGQLRLRIESFLSLIESRRGQKN